MILAAAFTLAAFLPFMGKAYHVDEPQFIALARQIQRDPLHPLDFKLNWYGRAEPMRDLLTNPPVFGYLLAPALALARGSEFLSRLLFLPFDLAAALALYLIAARFLSAPLLPTLMVVASPAYFINLNHLMPEKITACLGFMGLSALISALDRKSRAWYWVSAGLLGGAILFKYGGALFLAPAAAYALSRGEPKLRVALFLAAALSPLLLWFAVDFAAGGVMLKTAFAVSSQKGFLWSLGWTHRLRSFLAFTGGCLAAGGVWTAAAGGGRRFWAGAILAAAAAAVLFAPVLDAARPAAPADRALGIFFAWCALFSFFRFSGAVRDQGRALWAAWALGAAGLQLILYWGVLARVIVFLVPPALFSAAALLEARWRRPALNRLYAASLVLTVALSSSLAAVDFSYAQAQKDFARGFGGRYLAEGRKVWFTGHWGLQHYLEELGAKALDGGRGGWDEVKKGDIVLLTRVNYHAIEPNRLLKVEERTYRLSSGVPLRLLSGWTGQAGFYSNGWGFLPFAFSLEPVDEFAVVEVL